jgi:hypothetical protein
MLPREEYVEQAYLYKILHERLDQQIPLQELLEQAALEVLATTKLPMAISFLLSELRHSGLLGLAMARLPHYFSSYQTFLVDQAEQDSGRFGFRTALQIMEKECEYRADSTNRQGFFLYQFESLCRNRLNYDAGLTAMSIDSAYDDDWKEFILTVRRELGLVDLADLIFARSQEFEIRLQRKRGPTAKAKNVLLFDEKEGKIAFANRRKDPLFLFAAMQRHLAYPQVPKLKRFDESIDQIPQMQRRLERLESRIKLFEEEQRQGIDITKFYGKTEGPRLTGGSP